MPPKEPKQRSPKQFVRRAQEQCASLGCAGCSLCRLDSPLPGFTFDGYMDLLCSERMVSPARTMSRSSGGTATPRTPTTMDQATQVTPERTKRTTSVSTAPPAPTTSSSSASQPQKKRKVVFAYGTDPDKPKYVWPYGRVLDAPLSKEQKAYFRSFNPWRWVVWRELDCYPI